MQNVRFTIIILAISLHNLKPSEMVNNFSKSSFQKCQYASKISMLTELIIIISLQR